MEKRRKMTLKEKGKREEKNKNGEKIVSKYVL